ncbi:MAG: RNA polymerase sigma factor [Planctomycetota bacterium]
MANGLKRTMTDDEKLIRATLRGDISAFGTIVERYWNMVVGLAFSRIADAAEAEDIAQESFLKAYSQLGSLRKPSRFAGWLSKIALQECCNTVRSNSRCRTALGCKATGLEELNVKAAETGDTRLTESQIHLVRQTVRRLPEKFQKLIVMRFVAGLSAVQIAEQLGKRPGTVRVWLHRAYKILRKDLAPLLEEVKL